VADGYIQYRWIMEEVVWVGVMHLYPPRINGMGNMVGVGGDEPP
jgi:hypothetical protein